MGVDPCPNPTDIGNNNNSGSSGGGGNNNSNQNNSDNNTCDVYVLETDWYTCVSVGNEVPDCHYSYTEYELVYENCGPDDSLSANLENDDACSDDDDNVPIIEPEDFGYKVCNKHIAFDEIPGDGSETSLTGEVRRVQVPAVHTETGEHVEAFWGAWCITYGSSADLVNNEYQASDIFKEAWQMSTLEIELWLNEFKENPGKVAFSNQFLDTFRENIQLLSSTSGDGYVFIAPSTTSCRNTRSTWLVYCK